MSSFIAITWLFVCGELIMTIGMLLGAILYALTTCLPSLFRGLQLHDKLLRFFFRHGHSLSGCLGSIAKLVEFMGPAWRVLYACYWYTSRTIQFIAEHWLLASSVFGTIILAVCLGQGNSPYARFSTGPSRHSMLGTSSQPLATCTASSFLTPRPAIGTTPGDVCLESSHPSFPVVAERNLIKELQDNL